MKRVITVDYDDTLVVRFPTVYGGYSSHLVPKVVDIIKKEYQIGAEIYIVTFRGEKDKPEVERTIMLNKLPIKEIICTDSMPKTPFLKKLKSLLHIDDDFFTCQEAKKAGIAAIFVDKSGDFIRL